MRAGAVCLLVLIAAAPAAAEDAAQPEEPKGAEPRLLTPTRPKPPAGASLGYSHKGQIELSLRLPIGLRAIAPYDSANYCGATDASAKFGNAPVCTSRAPFSLDFEVGYGVHRRIDAFVELRVGLEQDFSSTPATTDGPHPFHISPGARFFFGDGGTSKLFTTAQVVFDLAGYKAATGLDRGADLGVRNLNGLWFDVDKAYGFYGYIGETATFARWMRFELEAGIGFQGRYP
jgi:hypothetical protein